MTRMHCLRRLAAVLAVLAGALLAFAAAPAAFASTAAVRAQPSWADPPLPPGWHQHPPPGHVARAAAVGVMPGWQIALLAAATALAAPTVAVLLDRARPAPQPGHRCRLGNARAQLIRATSRPAAPGQNHAPQGSRSWTPG